MIQNHLLKSTTDGVEGGAVGESEGGRAEHGEAVAEVEARRGGGGDFGPAGAEGAGLVGGEADGEVAVAQGADFARAGGFVEGQDEFFVEAVDHRGVAGLGLAEGAQCALAQRQIFLVGAFEHGARRQMLVQVAVEAVRAEHVKEGRVGEVGKGRGVERAVPDVSDVWGVENHAEAFAVEKHAGTQLDVEVAEVGGAQRGTRCEGIGADRLDRRRQPDEAQSGVGKRRRPDFSQPLGQGDAANGHAREGKGPDCAQRRR